MQSSLRIVVPLIAFAKESLPTLCSSRLVAPLFRQLPGTAAAGAGVSLRPAAAGPGEREAAAPRAGGAAESAGSSTPGRAGQHHAQQQCPAEAAGRAQWHCAAAAGHCRSLQR